MQLEARGEVLEVIVVRDVIADFGVQRDAGFVSPAAGHVPDGVTCGVSSER